MKKKGFKVVIKFNRKSGIRETVLKDITEIHFNYPSVFSKVAGQMIAFESDIQKTGYTYRIEDIKEFEAILPKR